MPTIELPDFGQVYESQILLIIMLHFQAKEGFSIKDGLKKAETGIGAISDSVGTPPTNKYLNDVEKLSTIDLLNSEAESQSSVQSSQVLLRKNTKNEELASPLNRISFEYIDKSEVEDSKAVIRELGERPVEGGPMIASTEDIRDIVSEVGPEDLKVLRRTKKVLYVSDLSTKLRDPSRTKSVYQKSQLYLGVLFLVSIYYSLPVLQMVFRYFIFRSDCHNHPFSFQVFG